MQESKTKIQIYLYFKLYTPESVETVSLYGDNEMTGNFEMKKAVPLTSTEISFGKIWQIQLNMPCTFGAYNYKFIINGKEEMVKKNRSLNLSGFSIYIYDKLSDEMLELLQLNGGEGNQREDQGTNSNKKKNTMEIVQQIVDMKKIHKVIKNTRWLNNNFELRIQMSETKYRAMETEMEEDSKYIIKFRPHHEISISQSSQYLIFCASSINELSFWADIYKEEKKISSVFVSSHSLYDLFGSLRFPVVDHEKGIELGLLTIHYLIITPFKHELNTLESITEGDLYDTADKLIGNLAQEPMYIGHRGSGMTTNPNQKHIFIENTLISFLAAKKSGSDFIEFDVQLTKDLVPVIAHDEEIMIPTKTIDNKDTVVLVPVNKIEFATLQKLKPFTLKHSTDETIKIPSETDNGLNGNHNHHHSNSNGSSSLKRNVSIDGLSSMNDIYDKKHTESIYNNNNSMSFKDDLFSHLTTATSKNGNGSNNSEDNNNNSSETKKDKKKGKKKDSKKKSTVSGSNKNKNKNDNNNEGEILEENEFWKMSNVFPSLEQLFRLLPQSVGFNIEIKYPDEEEYARYLSSIERNKYVDRILKVIFDNNTNGRKVFISSFDPLVCLLCSQKQLRYPVFFLTSGGTELYSDPRKNSIPQAINFCTEMNLAGIVTSSQIFLNDSNYTFIDEVHKNGLLILTYGSSNSDPNFIQKQIDNGVNACIIDTIHSVKASTKHKTILSKTKKIEDYKSNPYLNRLRHTLNNLEILSDKKKK